MLLRIGLVIAALVTLSDAANAGKVGPQFRVNTDLASYQLEPSVATLADGGFVVVWASQKEGTCQISAQRFSAIDEPVDDVIVVALVRTADDNFPGDCRWRARVPVVAGLTGGGFIVGWQEEHGPDDVDITVSAFGQRYTAAGEPAEDRLELSVAHGFEYRPIPAVASLSDGGFVFIWNEATEVFGQRFAADGTPGAKFRVDTTQKGEKFDTSVTGLSGRRFVAVWPVEADPQGNQPGQQVDIFAQRYNAAGARAGNEFRVNRVTRSRQDEPMIAGLRDGGFVVVWTTVRAETGQDISGQRYSAGGVKIGSEFRVNNVTVSRQVQPAVVGLSDGGFVVVWSSLRIGSGQHIFARRYTSAGAPAGIQFRADSTKGGGGPSVAALQDGGYVAVWSSNEDDKTPGIYGQRFGP